MILTRLGNKRQLSKKIVPYLPDYDVWCEPFFGAGGMFFNKPKAKNNILNDFDGDVSNLFTIVMDDIKRQRLKQLFNDFPIHSDIWDYYKKNIPSDDVEKALRFLFLSNYGYLGMPQTLAYGIDNQKLRFASLIEQTNKLLFNAMFTNCDFRDYFKNLTRIKGTNAMIYNDPPYLGTNDNYSNSFKENDSGDLFQCNIDSGHKFAISEFNHPFILEQAKLHNLNVVLLGERKNIKNVRIEVLVTNYENKAPTLF